MRPVTRALCIVLVIVLIVMIPLTLWMQKASKKSVTDLENRAEQIVEKITEVGYVNHELYEETVTELSQYKIPFKIEVEVYKQTADQELEGSR